MKSLQTLQLMKETNQKGISTLAKLTLKNRVQLSYVETLASKIEKETLHPMLKTHPVETSCIALQEALDSALIERSLQNTCLRITQAVQHCWELCKLSNTGGLRLLETKAKHRKGKTGRAAVSECYLYYSQGEPVLDLATKASLGGLLLNLILEVTPDIFKYQNMKTKLWHLGVTSNIETLLSTIKETQELYNITKAPMICPPKPWNYTGKGGGYLTERLSYKLHERLDNVPPIWIDTLNSLQNQAWTVESDFYKELLKIDLTPLEKALLSQAGEYLDKKCWFPYRIDITGRYIGLSSLHPQRGKFSKALMSFDKPQKVSKEGKKLQLVALAKAWGVKPDYLPAETVIRRDWRESKDPWTVYRLLWELNKDTTQWPISVDGTCNALQHYAALMKDKQTGQLVGMVTDLYTNLYSLVAAECGLSRKDIKSVILPYVFSKTKESLAFDKMVDWETTYKESYVRIEQILNSLNKLAPALRQGKEALQILYGTDKDFISPLGFKPFLTYPKTKKIRVPVKVGTYTKVTLKTETNSLDLAKRKRATAPNIIACLAAEHATRAITAYAKPIRYIFDDFGVLPNDIPSIKTILGNTLFDLYANYPKPNPLWDLQSVKNRRFMFW